MRISGVTFIRNAIKFDYPILEAIRSVLPLCDEVIVVLGNSEDGTESLLASLNDSKIKIVHSVWDDNLREGGKVLAVETDKGLDVVDEKSDWIFYIQGDEVLHEKYIPVVKEAMEANLNDKQVEGLLFRYKHFYGSYDYVAGAKNWYRNEIRVIRNDKQIRSYRDAQGFRKKNKKLKVRAIDAYIFHYGWVKPPEAQQEKQKSFNKYWHPDSWVKTHIPNVDTFDYTKVNSLTLFDGEHPQVMKNRIENMNWKFTFDPTKKLKISAKHRFTQWLENSTGYRLGEYKNYRLLDR